MYKRKFILQSAMDKKQIYAIFKVKTGIHNVDKEHRMPIAHSL